MTSRALRLAVLGSTVMLASVPVPALAQGEATGVRTFGHWVAGCDSRAECTAIGFSGPAPASESRNPGLSLRISVDNTSLTGFALEIVPLPGLPANTPAIRVGPDGADEADRMAITSQRRALQDQQAWRWLEALGRGTSIIGLSAEDSPVVTIDAAGFRDAWIALAEARGDLMRQAMPSTAGPSPGGQRPAQEPNKRVFPAHEVVSPRLPAIPLLHTTCPAGHRSAGYRQFMLPGTNNPPQAAVLWALTCVGPQGRTTHWHQSASPLAMALPLTLPDSHGGKVEAGQAGFADSVFDFDFGILRARTGPADREDCGVQLAWGWDGTGWFLLERREMPACNGLMPPDWIRTYVSP